MEAGKGIGEKWRRDGEFLSASEAGGQGGNPRQRLSEGCEVAGISRWAMQSCRRALNIADFGKARAQVAEEHRIGKQSSDGILAALDFSGIAQGMQYPLAQKAGSHRRGRAVESAEEGHAAAGARVDQLQVAL